MYDFNDPLRDSPRDVRQSLLWRLATQLNRDHAVVPTGSERQQPPRCRCCGHLWPCLGRQLAELGLAAAQQLSDEGAGHNAPFRQ
jgi:hypothetical protein